MNDSYDTEDLDFIAGLLEAEKKSHCRTRVFCLSLFLLSMAILLSAIGLIGYTFATEADGPEGFGQHITKLQFLAPLCAMMIGFFASWCACQNCINSIERSLYAARAQRYRLFAGFVRELQCTSKKKRSLLIDVVGSMVA